MQLQSEALENVLDENSEQIAYFPQICSERSLKYLTMKYLLGDI